MDVSSTLSSVLALNQQQFQDQLGVAIMRQQKQQQQNVVDLVRQASLPAGTGGRVDQTA